MLMLMLLACDGNDSDGVRGSGEVVSESREVHDFDEILLEGSGDLVVEVNGSESLVIEAEDNLMPLLTSEVRNGRLELGQRESISPTEPISYVVSAADLEGVSIAGTGDVIASNLDCTVFRASIAGSGSFDVEGSCEGLDVAIAGSGDFDGEELLVASASISIAGSGDALVNVTDALDVSIAGSGDVEYIGDPSLDIDVAGSGNVRSRS